jgi:O-methyltransferase
MGLRAVVKEIAHSWKPPKQPPFVDQVEAEFRTIWAQCAAYTMTSPQRGYGLYLAVDHVCRAEVYGDFIECGVWRGGSTMLAALTFLARGCTPDLWLYDTFAGMTRPSDSDYRLVSRSGGNAFSMWRSRVRDDGSNAWCFSSLEDVRSNMLSTGYPPDRLHFVSGKVEETLPKSHHERVSILRLDTDWYESTRIELETLYPRLMRGGVLILDDYGHWAGARKAVDDYFAATPLLLAPLDYTGRLVVKP